LKTQAAPEAEVLGIPFARNSHPMWVFDRETLAFLDVNDAAVHHYGYSREEFLSMKIVDIRPTEDVPELLRQTKVLRPQGPSTGAQWRHRARDGTVFSVAITSWDLVFHGRRAELVLARQEKAQ
jgi:two-component system cell cycle sensor histidine kinase/response regulator CckA